ncbi:MAG: MFS transporter [Leptospiraceae bacterium]|nr:MFS transporter [Leptospiraceae bacterium]
MNNMFNRSRKINNITPKHYISYFLGSAGYTVPFFLIALYLINFYNPPKHESLPVLLYQKPIWGFSILSIIIILVRVLDIAIDPIIANLSDKSSNPKGKRLPFMKRAFLPASFGAFLIFMPPNNFPSILNVIWVTFSMSICVIAFSTYVTPFLTHMSSLCKSEKDRINLSTFQGLGESIGVIIAGQAPFVWYILQSSNFSPIETRRISFLIFCIIAMFLMIIPLVLLKGTDIQKPSKSFSLKEGLKTAFSNKNFRIFIISYTIFIICVEMVQAGAFYFVTVLLELDAKMLSILISLMVPSSILAAPIANIFAKKYGKKIVIACTFLFLAFLMVFLVFLGKYPISKELQAYLAFFAGGLPLGSMSVLVMAVVTDIVEKSKKYQEVPEAIFVAGKNFSYKTGITLGSAIFASMILLGKDRGDDLGIRLSCALGCFLCLLAFGIFTSMFDSSK